MLLNGIDYNIRDTLPQARAKDTVTPPHLLIGRYNTDDASSWLTPAEAEAIVSDTSQFHLPISWEMGHFAFSECAYFNEYMHPRDYARVFGFLGNMPLQSSSRQLWFGKGLFDPSISDLILAQQMKVPYQAGAVCLGTPATRLFSFNEQLRSVTLGGNTLLRFGPLDREACFYNLENCIDVCPFSGTLPLVPLLH